MRNLVKHSTAFTDVIPMSRESHIPYETAHSRLYSQGDKFIKGIVDRYKKYYG